MFDMNDFEALADEFGGLAGWYIKEKHGRWTQEGWDDVMLRLYERRTELAGVEDKKDRGLVALQAFSTDPHADMLARIEFKHSEQQKRKAQAQPHTDFDRIREEVNGGALESDNSTSSANELA